MSHAITMFTFSCVLIRVHLEHQLQCLVCSDYNATRYIGNDIIYMYSVFILALELPMIYTLEEDNNTL